MLLYLHIPFCDSKCSYCAFNSYTSLHGLREDYMIALYTQLQDEIARNAIQKQSIETIFIGGGTPSTVPASLFAPIFELVSPYLKTDAEVTTEANPNSATFEWISGMKALGITRISFGTQTFDEAKLKFLNRAHSAEDTLTAVRNATKAGLNNISIDLIYGTSLDTKALLENDLKIAFSLPINHLSAYALTIEEGTPFEKTPKVANENESLTAWLFAAIEAQGFSQYEISNFGTYKSRHNKGYWEHKEYLGIGAGAVGYLNQRRLYPHSDVQSYIDAPLFKTLEHLSEEDIKMEKVLLGLRSCVGFDPQLLSLRETQKLQLLLDENKLIKDTKVYNTNYLLADELALFILD